MGGGKKQMKEAEEHGRDWNFLRGTRSGFNFVFPIRIFSLLLCGTRDSSVMSQGYSLKMVRLTGCPS